MLCRKVFAVAGRLFFFLPETVLSAACINIPVWPGQEFLKKLDLYVLSKGFLRTQS